MILLNIDNKKKMKQDFLKPQNKFRNMFVKNPIFDTEESLNHKKMKLSRSPDGKKERSLFKSLSDSKIFISKKIPFGHSSIVDVIYTNFP